MKKSLLFHKACLLNILLTSLLGTPMLHSVSNTNNLTNVATVRTGQDLCDQEKAYLQSRLPKIKNALEQILGMQLTDTQVPRIAVCASGGGCRAALATLGWIQGMEIPAQKRNFFDVLIAKIKNSTVVNYLTTAITSWLGSQQNSAPIPNNNILEPSPLSLLDATTYIASLSGSTWAVAGLQYSRMTPAHYLTTISSLLSHPPLANIDVEIIAQELLIKDAYGQPTSLIDIYGTILAQKFLTGLGTNDLNRIGITSYASLADTAQSPLPIHTAIFDNQSQYEWVEFSPYEVGSTYLNAFIPTGAFGRKFSAGSSLAYAPEQTLGYGMGVWGSAMSVNAKEFFNLVLDPEIGTITHEYLNAHFSAVVAQAAPLFNTIYTDIQNSNSPVFNDPLWAAKLFNWTAGMPNTAGNIWSTLTLTDAGIDINVPVIPMLRAERAVDIIIILDATHGNLEDDLIILEEYVTTHSLNMPKFDFTQINQICSVHQNPSDPLAPIIVYMPLIKIPAFNNNFDPQTASFASTFNFEYTQDQINLITGLTHYSMQQSQGIIIDVIKQLIAQKS